MQLTKIMAIDFGEKRIGIAVTDFLQILAIPLCVLENNTFLFDNLCALLTEHAVSKIILGYPLKEDGTETHATKGVQEFRNILETKTSIPIIYVDERYSSSIASERVQQSVTKKMKRRNKGLVDMNAAAVILEDFLRSV